MDLKHEIRNSKIPGPGNSKFDRNKILQFAKQVDDHPDNQQFLGSVLFFGDLLKKIRNVENLRKFGLKKSDLMRLIIAVGTYYLSKFSEDVSKEIKAEIDSAGDSGVSLSRLGNIKLQSSDGNFIGLSEYADGLGDALTMLCLHIDKNFEEVKESKKIAINDDTLLQLKKELDLATLYLVSSNYWNECLWNDHQIIEGFKERSMVPSNIELAKNRALAYHLRDHTLNVDLNIFWDDWFHTFSRDKKDKLCGTMLVKSIKLKCGELQEIELGSDDELQTAAIFSIQQEDLFAHGPLRSFLQTPILKRKDVTVQLAIKAWRFLHSLSLSISPINKPILPTQEILNYCPLLPKELITRKLSEALGTKMELAESVLQALTFNGKRKSELWYQPLINFDNKRLLLAIPCMAAPVFERNIEGWLELAGVKIDSRGKAFEHFLRQLINLAKKQSPISNSIQVCKHSFKMTSIQSDVGDIDVLITIGSMVIIIECKCLKWPVGAVATYNYHQEVRKGAIKQLGLRMKVINSDKEKFRRELSKSGIHVPASFKVVPLLVTHSAAAVGMKVGGVHIVSPQILINYLTNQYVKFEGSNHDNTKTRVVLKFYKDLNSAESDFYSYLENPPQLSDKKEAIKARVIDRRILNDKIFQVLGFQVEINDDEIRKKWGINY